MRKNQKKKQRGTSSGLKVLGAVLALLIVAGAGLVLWKLTEEVDDLKEVLTIIPTAAPKTTTKAAKPENEKKTTAAKTEEPEETTAAMEEEGFPAQNIRQKPLNQLISVVGWSLADKRPDGFHSKHMDRGDMAALTLGAMTLAAQGNLGLETELTATDDPNQVMLPKEEVDRLLGYLVKDGALADGGPMGTLVPMGSGWAVTLPDDDVDLPRTEILAEEKIDGGVLVTCALIQNTAQGEMILQTAMVEALEINGGFGYQLVSWVTQDEVRFSRNDHETGTTLSMGSAQRVMALELTWGESAGETTIRVGEQTLTVTPDQVGEKQVIVLNGPVEASEIEIAMDYPAALAEIRVY